MAYDYRKLLGKIVEIYGTQYKFAEAMDLSEHTISVKLNNLRPFKQEEITKACDLLGIPPTDMPDYFFTPKVQDCLT